MGIFNIKVFSKTDPDLCRWCDLTNSKWHEGIGDTCETEESLERDLIEFMFLFTQDTIDQFFIVKDTLGYNFCTPRSCWVYFLVKNQWSLWVHFSNTGWAGLPLFQLSTPWGSNITLTNSEEHEISIHIDNFLLYLIK